MAENIVGGAYVRIDPLLDHFRADLITKLKAATAGVKVTIPITADNAVLDALAAKLTALSKQKVAPKVKVEGAVQAIADLEGVTTAAEAASGEVLVEVEVAGGEQAIGVLDAIYERQQRIAFLNNLIAGQYRLMPHGPAAPPAELGRGNLGWEFGNHAGFGVFGPPVAALGPGRVPVMGDSRLLTQLIEAEAWGANERKIQAAMAMAGLNFQMFGAGQGSRVPQGQQFNPANSAISIDLTTEALKRQAAAAIYDAAAIARLREQMRAAGVQGMWLSGIMLPGMDKPGRGYLAAAAAAAGAAGGGGGGILMRLLFGRGGKGMGGGGFGRFGLGLLGMGAGMGSLASFAGLGPEHVLMTALGLAGSAAGGMIGGGILGAGALSTMLVGAGTNMAGIGQAGGDIKATVSNMNALAQAVAVYGQGSTQAANAQAQLNYGLSTFNPIAQGAVQNTANLVQGFKSQFDAVTGMAEKIGAQIIGQGVGVGSAYLPTIGASATQNMGIIKQHIQPLFAFLKSPTGGLGVFQELETLFSQRLPTAIHAGTMAAELFINTIGHVAPMTGGFLQRLDTFFTKYNSGTGLTKWMTDVDKLVADFRMWDAFVKILVKDIALLFTHDAGTAKGIVTYLTTLLLKLRAYEKSAAGGAHIHTIFEVHKQEILALLSLIVLLIADFGRIYLAVAPTATRIVTDFLKVILGVVSVLSRNPFGAWVLGLTLITAKLGLLRPLLAATLGAAIKLGALGLGTALAKTTLGLGPLAGLAAGMTKFGTTTAQTDALIASNAGLIAALDANTVAQGGKVAGGLLGGAEKVAAGGLLAGIGTEGAFGGLVMGATLLAPLAALAGAIYGLRQLGNLVPSSVPFFGRSSNALPKGVTGVAGVPGGAYRAGQAGTAYNFGGQERFLPLPPTNLGPTGIPTTTGDLGASKYLQLGEAAGRAKTMLDAVIVAQQRAAEAAAPLNTALAGMATSLNTAAGGVGAFTVGATESVDTFIKQLETRRNDVARWAGEAAKLTAQHPLLAPMFQKVMDTMPQEFDKLIHASGPQLKAMVKTWSDLMVEQGGKGFVSFSKSIAKWLPALIGMLNSGKPQLVAEAKDILNAMGQPWQNFIPIAQQIGGKIGAALAAGLDNQRTKLGQSAAGLSNILRSISPSFGTGGTGGGGLPKTGKAAGGPLMPGESAVVGERGIEVIQMHPGGGATVIPNHALHAMRFLAGGTASPTGTAAQKASFYNFEQLATNFLSTLQSIIQSGLTPLQQLNQQLNQTHARALQQLIIQLRATHQIQLVSLANQLVSAQKAATAALNFQIAQTWQQGTNQLIADMAQAAATLTADAAQMASDVSNAVATMITDTASIAAARATASSQAIADQSKLWVDEYGAKFQFGLAREAADAQVRLDKLNMSYDAEIGAAKVRAANTQRSQDLLVAHAQASLDRVQKSNDKAVTWYTQLAEKAGRAGDTALQAHYQRLASEASASTAKAQAQLATQQARAAAIEAQANAVVGQLQNTQAIAAAKIQAYIDKLNAQAPGAAGLQVIQYITSQAEPSAIAQEMMYEGRKAGMF